MLFKWQYSESPGMGKSDILMMGDVGIGEVYQAAPKRWRAICLLPDSSTHGTNFMGDFHSKGLATGALERVCSKWLTKSGLWTILGEGDTLAQMNTK
ncbi:hypothetical protein IAJ44_004237 [Salmonella enterica]|nr:hypothetical protein [Salmonella enterica]